ncbi:MAG TPA: hypothetical protein VI159_10780, partial [Gemmatimonadales bacterium]
MADRTKRRGEVLLHTGLTGTLGLGLVVAALATGCGGRAPNTTNSATDVSQAVMHAALPCNDSLKSAFRPD